MRYTSLRHGKSGNYQVNYFGDRKQAIADFQKDCQLDGAVWAYLFEEKDGEVVASYNESIGVMEA